MKNLMKFLGIAMVVFAMAACSNESKDLMYDDQDLHTLKSTPNEGMCKTNVYTLMAGKNINAGSVTIENDGSNLYVTVCSDEGFQNVEENIKILIGLAPTLSTLTKRPAAGHFPYKFTADPETQCFSIPPIPLSAITGSETCSENRIEIVVHADVIANGKAETAFSGLKTGLGRAWWYIISYRILCC